MNKIMLDKWEYNCNKNLSYKRFASSKLWNKIKTTYKPLHKGLSTSMYTIISMYTEILSYSICWMENNPDGNLFKVLVCLFLYLESNQVIILWKVSKQNKKN